VKTRIKKNFWREVAGAALVLGWLAVHPAAADDFLATGPMLDARMSHTATLLPDGKVLFIGGISAWKPRSGFQELYDPLTGTWSGAAAPTDIRRDHTATVLRDWRVLVVGGQGVEFGPEAEQRDRVIRIGLLATAELYEPASGTWTKSAHRMTTARFAHTATLLTNGKVLIAGGSVTGDSSTELYVPDDASHYGAF